MQVADHAELCQFCLHSWANPHGYRDYPHYNDRRFRPALGPEKPLEWLFGLGRQCSHAHWYAKWLNCNLFAHKISCLVFETFRFPDSIESIMPLSITTENVLTTAISAFYWFLEHLLIIENVHVGSVSPYPLHIFIPSLGSINKRKNDTQRKVSSNS